MSVKAGVSVRDITPDKSVGLFGYPRVKRFSTAVNDRLLVSALHLRTGSTGIIVVSVDLHFLDPTASASIINRISEAVSMPKERLFVSCTHTHSAPVTAKIACWMGDYTVSAPDVVYMEHVADMIVEAASEAAATTTPVELAWTHIEHFSNGELCLKEDDGQHTGVLAVRQLDGNQYLALLTICGLPPSVMDESTTKVSADFPCYSRKYLQEQLGAQATIVHFTAPCGDVDMPILDPDEALSEAKQLGTAYGQAVKAAVEKLGSDDFTEDVALAGRLKSVATVRKQLPNLWDAQTAWGDSRAEYDRLQEENADKDCLAVARKRIIEAEGIVYMVRAQQGGALQGMLSQYDRVDVQVLQIADGFLVGLPGMLYSDYARQIVEKVDSNVFIVALTNGDLQGCITNTIISQDKPCVMVSPFAPETGQTLVDAALSII